MNTALFLLIVLFVIKAIQYPVMIHMWYSTSRPSKRITVAWVLFMSLASDLILLGCILGKMYS
jgi:hypothetical protein